MCIPIFIATLFTIARIWKQPKCPSTDEWIKKVKKIVCVCVCVCARARTCSCACRNRISQFAFLTTWMDLEDIMFSEMSDRERQILHIFIHM